jgi:hypothetical protein
VKRRDFIFRGSSALLLSSRSLQSWRGFDPIADVSPASPGSSLVGKPVELASLGNLRSWINTDCSPLIQKSLLSVGNSKQTLKLFELPGQGQMDVGVEWPEFRTVNKVAVRFASSDKSPPSHSATLQYWKGLSPRQGEWKEFEKRFLGIPAARTDGLWEYSFPQLRTCKVRLLLEERSRVEVERFEVYGASQWKRGDVRLERTHSGPEQAGVEKLEVYNGHVLKVTPFGNIQLRGPLDWSFSNGGESASGVVASVLYTWGMDVDRTILTVRSPAGDYSFLPVEILEDQPIHLTDFGVYLRNNSVNVNAAEFKKRNAGLSRVCNAVAHLPEQTLENASKAIRVRRVELSFVGVDSNKHKFGVAPDGHFIVAGGNPKLGNAMNAEFGVFIDTAGIPSLFERTADTQKRLFQTAAPKHQELEEGWLPIITTEWSENDISFRRTDYGALREMPANLDESSLQGEEHAVLISRLKISNPSVVPQTTEYFLKPWKPAQGGMPYRAIPADVPGGWTTVLHDSFMVVVDQNGESVLAFVDTHGRGTLSLDPGSGAVKYSEVVLPGEQVSVDVVIAGSPVPLGDAAQLRSLDYDGLHDATVQYWKKLVASGMTVEVPDRHMQNLFDASLHHFLLAMTKDSERNEHYPNVAMLRYGSIGSESSPIMQALDMRGIHPRVESCLKAWLSTQGEVQPEGDYRSKEGGFYNFWPVYTIDQGGFLWALAEHYLYMRDKRFLDAVAKQMIDGCDFIIRERRRIMTEQAVAPRPPSYGLAPAGCTADMRDWEYSFMLNGYFYLALKKCAMVLQDTDKSQAARVEAEAQDYLQAIRRVLKECTMISPVVRLRDNTGVPSIPSYVGLRGLSTDAKDSVDPDLRHGYGYDSTLGPFHLLKCEVIEPESPEVEWMLNYLEDRFFLFTPLGSRVDLSQLSTDWFNLGGFEKLQPYYVHYQDAYLQRDETPNFLRGFFNTLCSIADPMTLAFQEELDEEYGEGGEPHKTHEEAWFFHQFRFMLVMEIKDDLFLARGTPREWLRHGKRIAVNNAPSYFGPLSYSIQSYVNDGKIEARVVPPNRARPKTLYLRLRHPEKAPIKQVTLNGRPWKRFNPEKEWIEIDTAEAVVVATY